MKKYLVFVLLIVMISCQKDNEENIAPDIDPEDLPEKVFEGNLDNPSFTDLQSFYNEQYTTINGDVSFDNLDYLSDLNLLVNLREIKGSLLLDSIPVNNLNGLNNLEKIEETLIISNLETDDLSGLDKFEFVDKMILYNLKLSDLVAFQALKHIGYLGIMKSEIENLSGLSNIETLEIDLHLTLNNQLKSLEGIEIKQTTGDVSLIANPELININALSKVTNINGDLDIKDSPLLSSFDVFENLEIINGDFSLGFLSNENVEGFSNLKRINGRMVMMFNEFSSFSGLDNLEYVGEGIHLFQNSKLKSLNGFGSLDYIGNDLNIDNNYSLQSLEGFNSDISFINNIFILGNTALNDYCSLSSFILSQASDYNIRFIHNAYNPTYQDFKDGNCSQNK